jgi:tetratricopeptide (TPR) repeat protein
MRLAKTMAAAGLLVIAALGPARAQDDGRYLRWHRCADGMLDPDARIAACSQLIKDNVTEVHFAWLYLGDAYAEARDTKAALAAYDKLGEMKYWRQPYARRGELRAATGDYPGALADAQKVIAMRGDKGEALANRCWIRGVAAQELDAALADCGAALAGAPDNSGYLDDRGLVLFRLGRMQEARAVYDTAIAHDSRLSSALYMRGVIAKKMGDAAAGDADIAAAEARAPKIAAYYDRLGIVPLTP